MNQLVCPDEGDEPAAREIGHDIHKPADRPGVVHRAPLTLSSQLSISALSCPKLAP